MIFTFQEINGIQKVIFFAESKAEAIKELHARYGNNADNFSLISFVPAEKFNLTYY
jgi:hypothetical protein